MKANYYRLARTYHPDRVVDEEKSIANEKFNILHQAYSILTNSETKKLYDNGETHILFSKPTVALKWEQYISPLTANAIEGAREKYQGSVTEENDVLREIVIGKGSITHLFHTIPFMRIEDESRIILMINKFIKLGKLQKVPIRKMRR